MLVLGLSVTGLAAGTLSGSWATDITITTPQTPVFAVTSVLTVNYLIAGWTFGSVSRFSVDDAWYQQDFRADGAIGAFTFTNLLRFDPAEVEFDFLRSTARVDIAGVTFDSRLMIVGAEVVPPPPPPALPPGVVLPLPATSGFRLGFSAPVPPLTFAAGAYFGGYEFDTTWGVTRDRPHEPVFRGLDVDITMPFFTTTLTIDVDFTSTLAHGFEDITFEVPRFPLGIPQLALDLTVTYTLTTKTVAVVPHITVIGWVHFQPFISIHPPEPVPPAAIEGLILEGLRLVWPVEPAVVTFTYEWDSRPGLPPHVAGLTVDGFARRQRIEIVYAVAPIRLDIEGRWVIPVGVPVVLPIPLPPMPAFPQQVEIDLEVDILENLALRTGIEFRAPVLHSISFGFTVTW
jgi:hypothetical protein